MAGSRVILQDGATGTANGKNFEVRGYATTVFQIIGTFSGTVTFEATLDGLNWVAIKATNLNDATAATTATAAGLYKVTVAGLADIRARISAYTSGTITVIARGVSLS